MAAVWVCLGKLIMCFEKGCAVYWVYRCDALKCARAYMCTHICVNVRTCTHACMHTRTHAHKPHTHMHARTHTHTHTYTHTHTHTGFVWSLFALSSCVSRYLTVLNAVSMEAHQVVKIVYVLSFLSQLSLIIWNIPIRSGIFCLINEWNKIYVLLTFSMPVVISNVHIAHGQSIYHCHWLSMVQM